MIPLSLIHAYLKQKLPGQPFSIAPILDLGFVNQVYLVHTEKENFVLRVNHADAIDAYRKESWCYEQAANRNIPVPAVRDVVVLDGASFMLLTQIAGENCSQVNSEPSFQTHVFKTLGAYVRALSTVTPRMDIGDLYAAEHARTWFEQDYLKYERDQTTAANDYLAVSVRERDLLVHSIDLLARTDFQFCLCHGDISLKNCLWQADTRQIVLIDFGSAETQIKDVFEIALKWIEVFYENSLSYEHFLVFVSSVVDQNAEVWLKQNLPAVEALSLIYTLDKYRWAHDRSPGEWEEKYKKRFYSVLRLLAGTG